METIYNDRLYENISICFDKNKNFSRHPDYVTDLKTPWFSRILYYQYFDSCCKLLLQLTLGNTVKKEV